MTLVIETLSDGTNSIDASRLFQMSSATAVLFDKANSDIRPRSINVSSITDVSTGDWEINFTNNFAYDDYYGRGTAGYGDDNAAGNGPHCGGNGYHPGTTAHETGTAYWATNVRGSFTGWESETNCVRFIGELV